MSRFMERLKNKKTFTSKAEEAYYLLMHPLRLTFNYLRKLDLVIVTEEGGIGSRFISIEEAQDAISALQQYFDQFSQDEIDQINTLDDEQVMKFIESNDANPFLSGWVYLMQQCNSPFYKIGQTAGDVEKRLLSLNNQNPQGVRLIHKFYCQNRRKVERRLHQTYAGFQVRGEWFELPLEDVEYICNLKGDV